MSDELWVLDLTDGSHEVCTRWNGAVIMLVRVRPTGLLEIGDLAQTFAPQWAATMAEALLLAGRIGDRPKPWEPWNRRPDDGPLQVVKPDTVGQDPPWTDPTTYEKG